MKIILLILRSLLSLNIRLSYRECTMEGGSTRSIAWLFDDYVRHMEHHMGQILPDREKE